MVSGASMNAECELAKKVVLGDHIMFVGKAVEVSVSDKPPLVLSGGKYWTLENSMQKPGKEELEKIEKAIQKYTK